ncbi:MAG: RagB/SusD family nutrient uptake outer membrane protein [Bacteroidota bacterium]
MKKIYFILLSLCFIIALSGCDLTLEPEGENDIPLDEAIQTLEDVEELLLSNYAVIRSGSTMGGNSNWMGSLLADQADRDPSSGFGDVQFINIDFNAQNPTLRPFWADLYVVANRSSIAISFIEILEGSDEAKNKLRGEALFLRSLAHFELVRYFALPYIKDQDNTQPGIPLRLDPVLEIESPTAPRSSVEATYARIIEDLLAAIDLLPSVDEDDGKPTVWAARALLAKVYFQQNNFDGAFAQANEVIQNGGFQLNETVTDIFDPEQNFSRESIWEIPSILLDNSSASLTGLYQSDRPFDPTYYADESFAIFARSEAADTRGQLWYNERLRNGANPPPEPVVFVSKFDNPVFNLPMLRLAEILLIRAESAAETNNTAVAVADLQSVRGRAFDDSGISIDFSGTDDLINQIREERQKEMAFEFSNIFHDLKRVGGNGESVTIGGLSFNSPELLFKIPDVEVNTNPLVEQNP